MQMYKKRPVYSFFTDSLRDFVEVRQLADTARVLRPLVWVSIFVMWLAAVLVSMQAQAQSYDSASLEAISTSSDQADEEPHPGPPP